MRKSDLPELVTVLFVGIGVLAWTVTSYSDLHKKLLAAQVRYWEARAKNEEEKRYSR